MIGYQNAERFLKTLFADRLTAALARRVEREVGEDAVGAGALEREQRFHHARSSSSQPLLAAALQHRVLAAHLVDEGRRLERRPSRAARCRGTACRA